MVRKKQTIEVPGNVEIVAETRHAIVCRVNRPMADHFFNTISHQIRTANESTGLKIVIIPYAVDASVEDVPVPSENK